MHLLAASLPGVLGGREGPFCPSALIPACGAGPSWPRGSGEEGGLLCC